MTESSPKENRHYLIIGQGLAGSLLAWTLKKQGKSVMIVDSGSPNASSRVAPGIINPLAGKRLKPSWRVKDQLPLAIKTYQEIEQYLGKGSQFFHPTEIVRLIRDKDQAIYFAKRKKQSSAIPYIGQENQPETLGKRIKDPFGSFTAVGSGWLDIQMMIHYMRRFFLEKGQLVEEVFNPAELDFRQEKMVGWRHWCFNKVIFCEGWLTSGNPWFKTLPFKPAKGEMLNLEWDREKDPDMAEDDLPQKIINRAKWLLPLGNGRFRAGASYCWDPIDTVPSDKARNEILRLLAEFLDIPLKVTGQQAGIRPIIRDYRPVLGSHPGEPRVAIFNGLGSKGVFSAPWLATRLKDWLLNATSLERELNVGRFNKFLIR